MFLPGQDTVVGNLKCHLFQPVPGARSPCAGAHIFFPTQVQQYQHQQSLVGGRRRQQGEAAGGGRRRRQQKEAAEGGSSADPTHTSIICHLSSSVTQGGFAAILSLSLPEGTVTCKGHHLGGGSDAIFPASLHTLVLGGCHLGKGISTILGVSLSLGEL